TTKQMRMEKLVEGLTVSLQNFGQPVERQRGRDVPRLAAHLVGHAERVDDRLLDALHDRLIEWVASLVEQDLQRGGHLGGLARDAVGGGEGGQDLARAVRGE